MIAVVAPDAAGPALGLLTDRGVPAWVAGQVTEGSGEAALAGVHPGGD